jgi:hypothetical protein
MADQSATNLRLDQAVSTTTTGWWLTYPEKYESVGMMTFPTEWKDKKCPKLPTRLPRSIMHP